MSDILDMVVATLTDATNKANEKAESILAATTDRTKRVHEIRTAEAPEDEKVAEFQAWFEKANAKIEEQVAAIDEYIKSKYLTTLDEDTLNAMREEYKELKTQVTSAVNFAKTVPGFSEETLANVPDLKSLRGGTSGGSGSGGKRPRVERLSFSQNAEGPWTEVDKDGKTNFTLLAQRISKESGTKVEVKDLQAAAFESAGTDDLKSLDGKVFTFAHSVGDKSYWVKVQPSVAKESETVEPTDNEADESDVTDEATA